MTARYVRFLQKCRQEANVKTTLKNMSPLPQFHSSSYKMTEKNMVLSRLEQHLEHRNSQSFSMSGSSCRRSGADNVPQLSGERRDGGVGCFADRVVHLASLTGYTFVVVPSFTSRNAMGNIFFGV